MKCIQPRLNGLPLALVVTLGCAPSAIFRSFPEVAAPPTPSEAQESQTDWGAKLFLDVQEDPVVEPPPTSVEDANEVVQAEPPPLPTFFASQPELGWRDEQSLIVHADLTDVCNAHVGGLPVAEAAECKEIQAKLPFRADKKYWHLRTIRVNTGAYSFSQLVLQTAAGAAALPVVWDVHDPNDPGCPSILRDVGIESVHVENGVLVIVTLGYTRTQVDIPEQDQSTERAHQEAYEEGYPEELPPPDYGARILLHRSVTLVRVEGNVLHTREMPTPMEREIDLGSKLRREYEAAGDLAGWARIPWRDKADFRVSADGLLTLSNRPTLASTN